MTTRYVENRTAGYPDIQVSTAGGETWASIPGPPSDDYRYPSGSSETIGVAGDIIWILISNPPSTPRSCESASSRSEGPLGGSAVSR